VGFLNRGRARENNGTLLVCFSSLHIQKSQCHVEVDGAVAPVT
jgi:hypothetical protein